MVIGLAVWELHLPGCGSLKEKRSVVKSLKDRLHRQFNLSVAETQYQDALQRAEISACVVATERRQAESVLGSADRFVETNAEARIVQSSRTFF